MHGLTGTPAGSPRGGCCQAETVRHPGAPYRLTWLDSSRRSIPIRGTQPKLCRSVVNIQVPGLGVAVSDRWLRFGGGRGVAVVAERGFRDDCGL